ncbi:uncharacterized protein TNCT_727241 [Trichonephila clavata]|uniref:Uncharacterized protein n=1 Tax=Trichonephila clavata TaxID=2740835 RepID=A0A8X6GZ88_TRICU|nr:uncharacterized protein TNCT_308571 [Trichonephila clavata]GFR14296.1 uncharacterized protein TNCT_727241 [Trichonephila clavata]
MTLSRRQSQPLPYPSVDNRSSANEASFRTYTINSIDVANARGFQSRQVDRLDTTRVITRRGKHFLVNKEDLCSVTDRKTL